METAARWKLGDTEQAFFSVIDHRQIYTCGDRLNVTTQCIPACSKQKYLHSGRFLFGGKEQLIGVDGVEEVKL